jgi:enoyl-CoA hydratase
MPGVVHCEPIGQTVVWRLDNPKKNNALDPAMLDDLARLAEQVERDRAVRAVILAGTGERAFCAGADIAAWGSLDPVDFMRRWIGSGHLVFDRLARLPTPVIGALRGYVFGGWNSRRSAMSAWLLPTRFSRYLKRRLVSRPDGRARNAWPG